jgi:hypothetical protein
LNVIALVLALLDFAPVFFLVLGLFFLAQLVDSLEPRARRVALAALVLVGLGAATRAISNVIVAVGQSEVGILATPIYVLGAPGAVLMAEALLRCWMKTIGRSPKLDPWFMPSVLSWMALFVAFLLRGESGNGPWRAVLMSLFLFGAFVTSLATAVLGWKRRLHMASAMLALQFAAIVIFVSIRAFAPQHPLIVLFAEVLLLAGQCAFAFACWRVAAEYGAKLGPRPQV